MRTGILMKITIRTLRTQKRNFDILETGFTGPAEFIFVWYLTSNNNIPSNHQFHFQVIVVRNNFTRI
jgi:hypothetical protein